MNPISLIVPSTDGTFTTTVVIAGIGIVFMMLVLLILVFYLFGKVVSKSVNSKKENGKDTNSESLDRAPMQSASLPALQNSPVIEDGIPYEVVAAISAAIATLGITGGKIKSIKRTTFSGRSPWANAAIVDNTRPF